MTGAGAEWIWTNSGCATPDWGWLRYNFDLRDCADEANDEACEGDDGSCQATGDLNLDGATNLLDVLQLVQAIVNPSAAPELSLGDLNCDESFNLLDVLDLVARIAGG